MKANDTEPETVMLTLIGGPTVLVKIGGLRLLTDPTFDEPQPYEATATGVRLAKRTGPAIAAADILPIDAVLLSHDQHFDNLDHAGRALLAKAGRVLTTKVGASTWAGRSRGSIRGSAPPSAGPAGAACR